MNKHSVLVIGFAILLSVFFSGAQAFDFFNLIAGQGKTESSEVKPTALTINPNKIDTTQVNIELADASTAMPVTSLKCTPNPTSSLVVNVKDKGAKGDGRSDDTKAIQAAVDKVEGTGGLVLIPAGTYLVDAVKRIHLKSQMTLLMQPGAILQAKPNDKTSYGVLRIRHVENVNVVGGIIQGERDAHQGKTGEWGMGIEIYDSKNIVVEKVISKNNWGDGFYVADNSVNMLFCDVVADNNRRQGMSVVSVKNIVIKDSTFQRTQGTLPSSGLDVEPNKGKSCVNVQVINSRFLHNQGSGVVFGMSDGNEKLPDTFTKDGLIAGNVIVNNGATDKYSAGILLFYQHGVKVLNNFIQGNVQDGIGVNTGSVGNVFQGNTSINNGNLINTKYGRGIFIYKSKDNIIENNTFTGNVKYDIFDFPAASIIKNNDAVKVKIGFP